MLREYMPWLATMDPFIKMGITLALTGIFHTTVDTLTGDLIKNKMLDGGDALLKKGNESSGLQGSFLRASGNTTNYLSDLTQLSAKLFIGATTAWWATNYYMEARGLPSAALDVASLPVKAAHTVLSVAIDRW